MTRLIFSLLFIISISTTAYAGWTGPIEVLSGKWGTADGEFGFERTEMANFFPRVVAVNDSGNIFILDDINDRVQVFNSDGSFAGVIDNANEDWSWLRLDIHKSGVIVVGVVGSGSYFYNVKLEVIKYISGQYYINSIDENIVLRPNEDETYYSYDLFGELISTNNKVERFDYPKGVSRPFFVDKLGNYYSDSGKYDKCFNFSGKIELPEPIEFTYEVESGYDPIRSTHSESGGLTYDIHGNAYAWQYTSMKYSVLKWTWVDDSNDSKSDCPK